VAENLIAGRSAFLALLKDEGVTHLFGNPGTTELPIMHALSDHPDLTYVLGLQESIVVAMADGFSRASGQLVACNVHVAPGLGNAMGALYNAKFTGTPMILTAGQQEQGHGLTEPLLYDPLVPIASPLTKWAVEVTRLEDLPRIVRRAAKVAITPPTGPVFISLPGDILNEEAGIELGHRTRVDTAMRPTDAALEALATRIMAAKNPVIVAGDELVRSDALAEAAALADVVGAPAYQQTVPYGAHFLSEHPAFMGDLGRNQSKVRATLEPYDLMIVLGADVLRMSVWDAVEAMPPSLPILQIGLRDWEMGKNYPTEVAVRGDVKETLAVLTPVIAAAADASYTQAAKARLDAVAGRNWLANREKAVEASRAEATTIPIQPNYFMRQLVDAIDSDVVVVNEGITTAEPLLAHLAYRDRYGYFGLPSGGIGWAIAASVGIQMAQPARPVVAVIGDGSAMYSIQALWSAANMKLPITYVICDNRGYRIIKQRLRAFHDNENYIGMDFENPEIDFVGLAQSLGMTARRVTDPKDVRQAIAEGVRSGKPNLIDVVVERSV
jgi:benzoylformate decarboxylase